MVEFKREKMERVYEAKVVELYRDYLMTPGGNTVCYDYIKHKRGGGAGVLLVDEEENTYLVKQYRNSIDAVDLEIPAGGYSFIGERGIDCALREAEEETGFIPQNMFHVSNMVSSIGTFDERTDVYIGTSLSRGNVKLDPDEYIEIIKLSVDEAIELIYKGEIVDSKTIAALFAYKQMRNTGIIN
ncbi:MAG: NUDIX hydrolase [Clostridium sp.]|nr:NUDIX hydrolase [Clostridium sp.]MCM1400202.1 NUDIX hydrolase [Clostridium sp.]MCM1460929.1 NUDIX hydrolase [Bacteroides sp.]